jgi:predicted MarR family transcription regulator
VAGFTRSPAEADRLADLAQFLRGQAGAYDQASRTAAVSLGEAGAGDGRAAGTRR